MALERFRKEIDDRQKALQEEKLRADEAKRLDNLKRDANLEKARQRSKERQSRAEGYYRESGVFELIVRLRSITGVGEVFPYNQGFTEALGGKGGLQLEMDLKKSEQDSLLDIYAWNVKSYPDDNPLHIDGYSWNSTGLNTFILIETCPSGNIVVSGKRSDPIPKTRMWGLFVIDEGREGVNISRVVKEAEWRAGTGAIEEALVEAYKNPRHVYLYFPPEYRLISN